MSRARSIVVVVLSLWSLVARADRTVVDQKIEYGPDGDKGMGQLYAFTNKGERGKKPGLVIIPEWWGLNDWAKNKAKAFAEDGYVALAVDLYRGQVASDPDTAHQLSRGLPRDRALRDLRAAIDALAKRPEVDAQRIGVIGWCMGGGYAIELAANDARPRATVAYYGAVLTDASLIAQVKSPLLGNYGGDDKGIAANDVRLFFQALTARGVKADLKIYPNAGHAFASSSKPEVYKADAAADADQRTRAFLAQYLKR
jgi:carboxymethylenebutenolidase